MKSFTFLSLAALVAARPDIVRPSAPQFNSSLCGGCPVGTYCTQQTQFVGNNNWGGNNMFTCVPYYTQGPIDRCGGCGGSEVCQMVPGSWGYQCVDRPSFGDNWGNGNWGNCGRPCPDGTRCMQNPTIAIWPPVPATWSCQPVIDNDKFPTIQPTPIQPIVNNGVPGVNPIQGGNPIQGVNPGVNPVVNQVVGNCGGRCPLGTQCLQNPQALVFPGQQPTFSCQRLIGGDPIDPIDPVDVTTDPVDVSNDGIVAQPVNGQVIPVATDGMGFNS